MSRRPLPVPDEHSEPFWAAADEGVLALARCGDCGQTVHPPTPVCPHCRSTTPDYRFEAVEGRGAVRSWTVLRQSFLPGLADDLPLILVDVAVDGCGDLRLIGRLLDGPDADLRVGAAVTVRFERLDDAVALPAFALVP